MKIRTCVLTFCLSLVFNATFVAHALDNKFTYQGRLTDGNSPATASYQMQFRLRDGPSDASAVLAAAPPQAVSVVDGLFSVPVDFPVMLFNGSDRWLEISVAPPATPTTFTVLLPRQQITPTPYALYAAKAGGLASGVPLNFSDKVTFGPVTGPPFCVLSAVKVDNLNSDLLDGLDSADFWKLTGNAIVAGQFLGTINDTALDLRVHGTRALRLEPTAGTPNLIGGAAVNVVPAGTIGSVIAGGGVAGEPNLVSGEYNGVGGGLGNGNEAAKYSFLGGGHQNGIRPGATNTFLGGGAYNIIGMSQPGVPDSVRSATLTGGEENIIYARADHAAILGGRWNRILPFSYSSSIVGGESNLINAPYSTIGGGTENTIHVVWEPFEDTEMSNLLDGNNSVIAGGYRNRILGTNSTELLMNLNTDFQGLYSTISGGKYNTIIGNVSSIAGGTGNTILYAADFSAIGGGYFNWIGEYACSATIGGGADNVIQTNAWYAVVSGGRTNTVEGGGRFSTIAGGRDNVVRTNAMFAAIGGGMGNSVSNQYSTVPGGRDNTAGGRYSFAAGHRARARHTGSFLWADSTDADFASTASDQFCVRANGGVRFVTGGAGLTVDGQPVFGGQVGSGQLADGAALAEILDDDGSGSGLDADLLDGLDASAFAASAHNHGGEGWFTGATLGLAVTTTSSQNGASALRGHAESLAAGVALFGVAGSTMSPSGAGVSADGSGSSGIALRIANGGIRVSGAGVGTATPVFVHRATSGNIEAASPHRTTITHPLCDDDPNAILIVTPNFNPGGAVTGVIENHPIGVYFHPTLLKWQIFHQDFAAMTASAAYNVLVIKP